MPYRTMLSGCCVAMGAVPGDALSPAECAGDTCRACLSILNWHMLIIALQRKKQVKTGGRFALLCPAIALRGRQCRADSVALGTERGQSARRRVPWRQLPLAPTRPASSLAHRM